MQIELFPFADLSDRERETLEQANETLRGFRAQRIEFLAVEGIYLQSKLAWKVAQYRHAVVYRLVALAETLAATWNAQNLVGCSLAARALIETAALLYDLAEALKRYADQRDIFAIDTLMTSRALATRDKAFLTEFPDAAATNIITLIDKMERRKIKGVRAVYDQLSEVCHPNYSGLVGFFGSFDPETFETRFSATLEFWTNKDALLGTMALYTGLRFRLAQLERLENEIADLQRAHDEA